MTRQMWADLKALQSTLPTDPTNTSYGPGMSNPAQNMWWYEAVLFANLSLQNGFTSSYYTITLMSLSLFPWMGRMIRLVPFTVILLRQDTIC